MSAAPLRRAFSKLSRSSPLCALASSPGLHSGRRGTKNFDWFTRARERLQIEADQAAAPALPPYPVEPFHGRARQHAWLDVSFSSDDTQKIIFELCDDIVPLATQFILAQFSSSQKGQFFHIRKGFIALGHTHTVANGSMHPYPENFIGRHTCAGVLTLPRMSGSVGGGVNGSLGAFGITLAPAPHLDALNVVCGRVVVGASIVERIGNAYTVDLRPASPIAIRAGGRVSEADWASVSKDIEKERKATASKAVKPAAKTSGNASGKAAAAASPPA